MTDDPFKDFGLDQLVRCRSRSGVSAERRIIFSISGFLPKAAM
jgi:hypothetical protein